MREGGYNSANFSKAIKHLETTCTGADGTQTADYPMVAESVAQEEECVIEINGAMEVNEPLTTTYILWKDIKRAEWCTLFGVVYTTIFSMV